ncbi:TIGR03067 domain-containing protein [Zavarzinella formosa]|uniref:TIGR03067 domain-containing protein n=1 Tax=Zavarzinella formosa TaxID=360055 RepID=UPI0003051A15|nr:TIGR03067 domain-containing protein [Zavarzinella formosa]
MKRVIAIFVAVIIIPAGIAAEDESKADLRKMEGTWEIVAFEMSGKKMDAGKGSLEKIVIKDGKMTLFAAGMEIPTFKGLKLELNTTLKPKAADMLRGEKETLPCIYELTVNELKLAMPLVPKDRKPGEKLPRPESFDSKDKPFMVLTAKRGKE